jgi:hypothetical protein
MVSHEVPVQRLIADAPDVPAVRDDRPYNEYFLLRRWLGVPRGT